MGPSSSRIGTRSVPGTYLVGTRYVPGVYLICTWFVPVRLRTAPTPKAHPSIPTTTDKWASMRIGTTAPQKDWHGSFGSSNVGKSIESAKVRDLEARFEGAKSVSVNHAPFACNRPSLVHCFADEWLTKRRPYFSEKAFES